MGGSIKGDDDESETKEKDVIAEHRKKNHANRPPNVDMLHYHVNAQAASDPNNADGEEEEEDENSIKSAHAIHNSSGPREPSSDTLQYYLTQWKVILIQAKYAYHFHLATIDPFPERDANLGDTADLLSHCIDQHL